MFFQRAYEGLNDWWRWLVTIVVVIAAYIFGQIPFSIVYAYYALESFEGTPTPEEMQEMFSAIDMKGVGMDLNVGLTLLLLMFVAMGTALLLMVKALHQRDWKTMITPFPNINWDKIFFSFLLWGFFSMLLEGISYYMNPEVYQLTFELSSFIPLLIIVVLLMPIQTSTEELLFRGYLTQGFGIWTQNKLIAIVITSVLFAAVHMMNPEVQEFGMGIMFTYYFSVGFFLGLITVMDGSLELALGVHAATNMFSALFVSYDGGALQTTAVFNTEVVNVGLMLPVFFAIATLYFIICWKKYHWQGWSILFEPIKRNPDLKTLPPDLPEILDAP